MQFIVADELFEKLPDVCFGVISAKGIDNTKANDQIHTLLSEQIIRVENYFENKKVKESAEIIPYRDAMQALGVNPNKFMCSIEALMSRLAKKKGLPHINPAVDLGNVVSLKYLVPLGAHDMDTFKDKIEVRLATELDSFVPFGSTESEKPEANEFVYVSGNAIRTRRWIWRQSELGKITENSSNIFFPLDGFLSNKDAILAARDELAQKLVDYFGCTVTTHFIDKDNRSCEI